MTYFLGDISAFRFWFGVQRTVWRGAPAHDVPAYEHAHATIRDLPVADLASLGIPQPWHLDVPRQADMRRSARTICHTFSSPPPGTFVRLGRELYIESAHTSLIHLAPRLSPGSRIAALNHLLGTYAIGEHELIERRPLITPEALARYLATAAGMHGIASLRPLCRYATACTASPAESRIAALLFLPPRLGGRGLPLARANVSVPVSDAHVKTARIADFYWDRWRLILEYDSDAHHAGAQKLGDDNVRRTQLASAGYRVVTLTNRQLHERAAFEDVVAALLRIMGKRGRWSRLADYEDRERELRDTLFGTTPLQELCLGA